MPFRAEYFSARARPLGQGRQGKAVGARHALPVRGEGGMNFAERKPNRLPGFDYSLAGYYFFTVCVKNREEVFGFVKNGEMYINPAGLIVLNCWKGIVERFEDVKLDEFMIMPNHLHGVIALLRPNGEDPFESDLVGTRHALSVRGGGGVEDRKYQRLPVVMGSFKAAASKEIRRLAGKESFKWQRSYYDHIVRNDWALGNIRRYIRNNPRKWKNDFENLKVHPDLDAVKREKRLINYYDSLFVKRDG